MENNASPADWLIQQGFRFERANSNTVTIFDEILNDAITAEVMSATLKKIGIASTTEYDGIQVLIPEGQGRDLVGVAKTVHSSIVNAAPHICGD